MKIMILKFWAYPILGQTQVFCPLMKQKVMKEDV